MDLVHLIERHLTGEKCFDCGRRLASDEVYHLQSTTGQWAAFCEKDYNARTRPFWSAEQ